MPSTFNQRFAFQFEKQEAEFNANPDTNAGTLSADDGIDHASLQAYLSGDSSVNDHGSTAFMDPPRYQRLYDVQEADSFPNGTCNMDMLELNRSLMPLAGAGTSLDNTSVTQGVPQPEADHGADSALHHDFEQGWPLDGSDFLLPDLSTDLSGGQPGYRLNGSLGSAELAGTTPSFHAEDQPLAGAPAAYQPIGYQNTLAQAGTTSELVEDLPSFKADLPMPGGVPERTQLTVLWEMRNNKYFCLHAGCRSPSFKRLGDLERHQNNVHDQTEFFWCRYDGCDRGRPFPRKDKRNEHERKVHHVDYTLAESH